MSVVLRLRRDGAKKAPFYHVIATDRRAPRDGGYLERLGYYAPGKDPALLRLSIERVEHWLSLGAQTTPVVGSLIKRWRKTGDVGKMA